MFLEKFEVGKRYRFNNEIYSNCMESMGWANNNSWNVLIHLKEVTILDDRYGYIENYIISPEWCEEIVNEPLKTEELLYLEVLEEVLDAMEEHTTRFVKDIKSEIERVIDELGLEE